MSICNAIYVKAITIEIIEKGELSTKMCKIVDNSPFFVEKCQITVYFLHFPHLSLNVLLPVLLL